jgi:hypothetical protein
MRCFLQSTSLYDHGLKTMGLAISHIILLVLSYFSPILLRGTVFKRLRSYLLLAPLASLPYHVTSVGSRFSDTSSFETSNLCSHSIFIFFQSCYLLEWLHLMLANPMASITPKVLILTVWYNP